MKSIMHSEKGICYMCEKLYGNDANCHTEEHHVIFGTANRKLAEKYGLKVYLCLGHHRTSSEAVHVNHDMARMLQEDAQEAFENHYPDLSFREIFGRNFKTASRSVNTLSESDFEGVPNGFIPLEGV